MTRDEAVSDAQAALPAARIVHEGRGGHVEIEGCRYPIEMFEGGRFCIHFPCGQRHPRRALHLAALKRLAQARQPAWWVEDARRTIEEGSP